MRFTIGRTLMRLGLMIMPSGQCRQELTQLLWTWNLRVQATLATRDKNDRDRKSLWMMFWGGANLSMAIVFAFDLSPLALVCLFVGAGSVLSALHKTKTPPEGAAWKE